MEEKRGNGGETGENGGKTGGKRGGKWGRMGTVMNGSRCSGLLHCHYFLYAHTCSCCSHLHTDMSNFHPYEGILYVRIQHLVSQKWALSSDISKALTRLGTSSKSSAAIGLAGNARDGKWVPAHVAPQCVRSAHKNACASAMATAAATMQLQWEGTGQPRDPPKRFPRGKPETGQHITKQHEATGGAVHLLACTAASMGYMHIDDFLFAMCVTLWGWDA